MTCKLCSHRVYGRVSPVCSTSGRHKNERVFYPVNLAGGEKVNNISTEKTG